MLSACWFSTAVGVVSAACAAVTCRADIDPNSGIDLVRIGSPGNAPWMGGPIPGDEAIGRGGVNYQYSIGKFEVTTAQWCEFMNAAFDRATPLNIPSIRTPQVWGATTVTPQNGGTRWTVPARNAMLPVGGITWRTAAIYCNWLNNNKSTDPSAFTNGAYDTSTFTNVGTLFNDQISHNSNARYWIPTLDEWIKAAHYDPNRNGLGQGGYWLYCNSSDIAPIPAPPPSMGGNGQVNGVWDLGMYPSVNPFAIPLGAYGEQQSPWGLFDTGGATEEWSESVAPSPDGPAGRYLDGSNWFNGFPPNDLIGRVSVNFPVYGGADFAGQYGIRIASSIPSPASGMLVLLGGAVFSRRRQRLKISDDRGVLALVLGRWSECTTCTDRRTTWGGYSSQ